MVSTASDMTFALLDSSIKLKDEFDKFKVITIEWKYGALFYIESGAKIISKRNSYYFMDSANKGGIWNL